MTPLAKQLRVSLLTTLGFVAFGVLMDLTDLYALLSGDFLANLLANLGDDALTAVVLCTFVAAVHTVIYAAMRFGRPETREARGVRAGLVLLLALDVLPLFVAGYVVLALIPLLTAVGSWGWARYRGLGANIARVRALLFGVLSLLVQGVVALIMTMVG
jgi:hypothetical protein